MGKAFRVWPKKTKRLAGQVIAPAMVVTVVTQYHQPSPFSLGLDEVRAAYLRIYNIDIKKMGCISGDFNYELLDK